MSDHSSSTFAPSLAVALGASIIEKHITISNKLPGPDHSSSLNPDDFLKMVNMVRLTEKILGDGVKKFLKRKSKTR